MLVGVHVCVRWSSCGRKPEYLDETHLSDLGTTWPSHMPTPGIERPEYRLSVQKKITKFRITLFWAVKKQYIIKKNGQKAFRKKSNNYISLVYNTIDIK